MQDHNSPSAPEFDPFEKDQEHNSLPTNEILTIASDISPTKIAEEILDWLIHNVEMYIDNQKRTYKLDMIIEDQDPEGGVEMHETRKLQNLYHAVPEDKIGDLDETGDCLQKLHNITKQAKEIMQNDDEKLTQLFRRMIYYYEMQCIHKGRMITKNLEGEVAISNFEYEAFSVGVQLRDHQSGETMKNYVVPEGFTVELEIAYRDIDDVSSLF